MKFKALPAAQDLQRGETNSFKALLAAIAELQSKSVIIDDLIGTGLVAVDARGRVYDPSAVDETAFTDAINIKPEAPSDLSARASISLAFLSWTIPKFQPQLAYAEVWELAAPLFSESTDYEIGDFVTYEGTVYIFTSTHPAGAWNAGHVNTAGAGDLVIGNANNRHQSPISTAIVPLDVNGGTSYFWVRLVTSDGVAGEFSSSIGVQAQSLAIAASNVDVVSLIRTGSNLVTGGTTSTIPLTNAAITREIDQAPAAVLTANGAGEVTIKADQGYSYFRQTAFATAADNGAGKYTLHYMRNGVDNHNRSLGNTSSYSSSDGTNHRMSFITPWLPITPTDDVIYLRVSAPTGTTILGGTGIGLQVELMK